VSTFRLDKLFAPRSVALIGGSPREKSVGRAVLTNLRRAGYDGALHLVNLRYPSIDGISAVKSICEIIHPPDLVIIAAPPRELPGIIEAAGQKGCAAAIIITSGLGHGSGSIEETVRNIARTHGIRLIGPNCLGVLVPSAKLNASFAAHMPKVGDLALISQSGAIVAGVVEWAANRNVGFSGLVSLGDQIDVDFGDLLDHFALDRHTRAILLYIESISDARKFMSAARAAARIKPVVVIKSGRFAQGAKAAATHTGALAGSDAVYDAAFGRAGLLRVFDLDELFAAAETLGLVRPFTGNRLSILTNGGGIGVLAVDRLVELGGTLATLSPETTDRLNSVLPPIWSKSIPVDIAGDADAERYEAALEILLSDNGSDAVLVMNVPTALASAADAANASARAAEGHRNRFGPSKPVFAVWVGENAAARTAFETTRIPHFATESEAIQGFMHLVRYREVSDLLMETPPSLPEDFQPDVPGAKAIVQRALQESRSWLDPIEAYDLLAAYGIPVTPAVAARDAEEAVAAAKGWFAAGSAIAVKIHSRDIVHKSDVGGVRLNITNEDALRQAVTDILASARAVRPDARLMGVTIHPMIIRPKARELIAGIADDPTFGPVIVFGRGGVAVEVINDKALALPPLDLKLAQQLIARTRVSRVLKAYRDVPATDQKAIALVLVKLAQLSADLPEIRELDLNPLLADEHGIIAVDARIAVAPADDLQRATAGNSRFSIRPYPKEWERRAKLPDEAEVFIRPVRPEDEALYLEFFPRVSAEDIRMRFFAPVKEFSHAFIARFTQLDYARAMAFIALSAQTGEMLGVVRLHESSDRKTGEYAILVRSDVKGRGLGWLLMQTVVEYARAEGLISIEGQVLSDNVTMVGMCRQLGFSVQPDPDDADIVLVRLELASGAAISGG
jgi:acetyltransferase